LAFEPTVHDLSIIEDLLDALLDVNQKYLSKEFVTDMKKKNNYKVVTIIEPAPDNELRPDAPTPKNPPKLDILTGAYWGASMGNLSDKD